MKSPCLKVAIILCGLFCFVAACGGALPSMAQTSGNSSTFIPNPTAPKSFTFIPDANPQANVQVTALLSQISDLNAQVSNDQAQLAAAAAQAQSNAAAVAAYNTQIAADQAAAASAATAAANAQATITANQTQIASLMAQIVALTGTATPLQAQVASLTAQVGSLNGQITTISNQNNTLTQQLLTSQNTVASLNMQIATLNASVTSLTAQNVSLTAQLAAKLGLARSCIIHSIPTNGPYYDDGTYYGSLMPLAINTSTANQFAQVAAAGGDGIAVDLGPRQISTLTTRYASCDAAGITIAPCIDIGYEPTGTSEAQIVKDVEAFMPLLVSAAAGHTSAQKDAFGKLVCWTYNNTTMTPQDWIAVRAYLVANNLPVSITGDVGGAYIGFDTASQSAAQLALYSQAFDTLYNFSPFYSNADTATLLAGYAASAKPFVVTARAGYNRVVGTGSGIINTDANGTGTFTSTFSRANNAANAIPAQCVTLLYPTLEDEAEETGVTPDTYWGFTRTDFAKYFAAQFKHLTPPGSGPVVYNTVRQSMYLGQTGRFETAVWNPTPYVFYNTTVVQNTNSQNATGSFGGACPPFTLTTYSTSLTDNATSQSQALVSGVSYLRMQTTLTNSVTGQQVATLGSPYTALYVDSAPTGGGQPEYFSLSSNHALVNPPQATVNISSNGTITATITPSTDAGAVPHILILYHDTRRFKAWIDTTPTGTLTLTADNQATDNRSDTEDHGCWNLYEESKNGFIGFSRQIPVTHL